MHLPRSLLALAFWGIAWSGGTGGAEPVAKEMLERQLATLAKAADGEPAILRLDEELEELLARAKKLPAEKQVPFLAAGLSSQARLYATFGMSDLDGFAKYLLGRARYPHIQLGREAFADRDLSAEIRTAYAACAKSYGKALPKAPVYKVAFGYQRTTNAQVQGVDPRLGRHVVVFNRSALTPGRLWDAAIIHESWHCFQKPMPMPARRTLLDWAIYEGVVTHLTQVVDPSIDDATTMLWSEAEWRSAVKHRDAIIAAFAELKDTKDRAAMTPYMILGKRPAKVPGAPSRSGYYVGLLAARAWSEANPDKGARELLEADPDELWRALEAAR